MSNEYMHLLLGGILGCIITVVCMYPVYQERNELRDTLNQVTIELGDRDIVIDWSALLKKD